MKTYTLPKSILICLIIAALFFVLSMPYSTLVFPGGMAELRFSGFLPMLCGLLFGPLGALGCALGNILSDMTKVFSVTDIFGTVGVFLMGYLPYKLWHGTFSARQRSVVFFGAATSVLKYVGIAFIAAVCATATATIGGHLFDMFDFADFFPPVVLQYFDLSVLLGMLLFHLLTGYAKIRPKIPARAYEHKFYAKRYAIDYVLCGIILLVSFGLLYLGSIGYAERSLDAASIVLLCLIGLLALLPFARSREKTGRAVEYKAVEGLQKQFVTGFLTLLCAMLFFNMALMAYHMFKENETGPALWNYVLSGTAGGAVALLLVLFALLKWIETHVTQPVCKTSEYAENFVKSDKLSSADLMLPKTGNEIDGLGESIGYMTKDIRTYVSELREKTAAEERLAVEMNTARGIQMGLLPEAWTGGGVDIAANIQPAREVGGDFYDFYAPDEKRVFVAVADVSGKGISAALFMMRAKTLLNVLRGMDTAQMLEHMNNELARKNETMMFVTMFAGVIDLEEKTFTYVNAGHNPPIVYKNGEVKTLDTAPDFVLAPMEGTKYKEHSMQISEDFKLLLYTDGVTEAQNTAGEFLGEQPLLQAAKTAFEENLSAQQILSSIQKTTADFSRGAQQADDITIVCLTVK